MTAKAKVVNYTPEQTAQMVEAYVAAPTQATVESLAAKLGKTVRSIVAKLSREKVYQAKVRTTKTGDAIVKMDETADAIGAIVGLTEADITSLTKANKTALVKILAMLPVAEVEAE